VELHGFLRVFARVLAVDPNSRVNLHTTAIGLDKICRDRPFPTSAALIVLAVNSAHAQESPWWMAIDFGESTQDRVRGFTPFDVYRITLRKEFSKDFWSGEKARLGGFWEGSVNYWHANDGELYAAAIAPVFALYFGSSSNQWQPYIEGAIGAAYISETHLAGRQFSTHFQFENRLGIGLRGSTVDFHVRLLHYSNADIDEPNNGMYSFVAGIAIRF